MYVSVRQHTYLYMHMYARMYVCMYVRTYVIYMRGLPWCVSATVSVYLHVRMYEYIIHFENIQNTCVFGCLFYTLAYIHICILIVVTCMYNTYVRYFLPKKRPD